MRVLQHLTWSGHGFAVHKGHAPFHELLGLQLFRELCGQGWEGSDGQRLWNSVEVLTVIYVSVQEGNRSRRAEDHGKRQIQVCEVRFLCCAY